MATQKTLDRLRVLGSFVMARFYFHFREDGNGYVDDVGHELPDLKEAEQEASVTATSLLKDAAALGKYEDVYIEVTNQAGFALVTVRASIVVKRVKL